MDFVVDIDFGIGILKYMLNKIVFNISQVLRNFGVNFNENSHPKSILMKDKIQELGGIKFKIEFYPDGRWAAESTNVDGIITGSDNVKEINNLIKDAIFTYFEIPPHLCNDKALKADNEPVMVTQKVYA